MDKSGTSGTPEFQFSDADSGWPDRDRTVSPDTMLSIVANEHRRAVLNVLDEVSEKRMTQAVLVERVAGRLLDEETDQLTPEQRNTVQIKLQHSHLPKLDDAGLIDHEREAGHVQFTGGEVERELLALIESYDSQH